MTHHIPTAKYIHLEPGEIPEIIIRKHWTIFVAQAFGVLFAGFFVLLFIKYSLAPTGAVSPILTFIAVFILLILWLSLFTLWTNYYLDIWIVTSKRVINIDQIALFRRSVSSMRDEHVQDVVVQKRGIIQEFFNFGTLRVQSAGAENRFFIINGIPQPAKIQRAILNNVNKAIILSKAQHT